MNGPGPGIDHAMTTDVPALPRATILIAEDESAIADALAVALCHIHTQKSLVELGQAGRFRRGRLR